MSDKIREQYKAFAQWCYDNRRPGLDPRLHQHGGPIERGGYIADPKTAAAFAAWRAALAQQPAPVAHEPVARAFGKVCGGDAEHNTVNVRVCGPVPPDLWTIGTAVALCVAPPAAEQPDKLRSEINALRTTLLHVYRQLAEAERAAEQPDAWTPSGADYDRNIHRNPDAAAWADLFVATFPGLADKHDLMLGWFANAMMAMHDFLKAERPDTVKVPREVLRALTDTAITEWHDPSENEAAQDRNECLCCGVEGGHNADCAVAIALRLLRGGAA